MQSEGGAAGAVHGALQAGSLTTTFTASQGLLLMLPDMFKIAGELTPFVMHVAARAIATHALSIFGDHSDVMAARGTGFAILASSDVQEAHDFAAVATAATLRARIPFLHFFDGFRTSHEINVIEPLSDDDLRAMVDDELVDAHRDRALSPDHPVIRGSAQNPDVFFQSREAANPYHAAVPGIVAAEIERFATLTGRRYRLFDYVGAPDAERVVVVMGSGAGAVEEAVEALVARGEKVGLVKVRLYRPFDGAALAAALPETVQAIAVLDRSKDPAAVGEPLYEDVVSALIEHGPAPGAASSAAATASARRSSRPRWPPPSSPSSPRPRRAGTSRSGSTTTSAARASPYDPDFSTEPDDVVRCVFYGLGSDGTVGANKNSAKIIGEETPLSAQAYFVYDSKKSGSTTISHLRFGPRPIRSSYLIERAQFVACHQFDLLSRMDVLAVAEEGATFLLSAPYGPDEVWDRLPRADPGADRRQEAPLLGDRREAGRARSRPAAAARTPCSRPASSPSRACCRASARSARSRRRSRRRTRSAARRSSTGTSRPSTSALDSLHEVDTSGALSAAQRPAHRRRRAPRTCCARCSPARATGCP